MSDRLVKIMVNGSKKDWNLSLNTPSIKNLFFSKTSGVNISRCSPSRLVTISKPLENKQFRCIFFHCWHFPKRSPRQSEAILLSPRASINVVFMVGIRTNLTCYSTIFRRAQSNKVMSLPTSISSLSIFRSILQVKVFK